MKAGKVVNFGQSSETKALYKAILEEEEKGVRLAIAAGADIHRTGIWGDSGLFKDRLAERWITYRLLLRAGANLPSVTLSAEQKASYAGFSDDTEQLCNELAAILHFLLVGNLPPDLIRIISSYWLGGGDMQLPSVLLANNLGTQVRQACRHRNAEKLRLLMELKPNLDQIEKNDDPMLHKAIESETETPLLPTLQILIESKADVNALTHYPRGGAPLSPLVQVVQSNGLPNKVDCVRVLLDAKADVDETSLPPSSTRRGLLAQSVLFFCKDRRGESEHGWEAVPAIQWNIYLMLITAGLDEASSVPMSDQQKIGWQSFGKEQSNGLRQALVQTQCFCDDNIPIIISYCLPASLFASRPASPARNSASIGKGMFQELELPDDKMPFNSQPTGFRYWFSETQLKGIKGSGSDHWNNTLSVPEKQSSINEFHQAVRQQSTAVAKSPTTR